MERLIDELSDGQRLMLLQELLQSPSRREAELIAAYTRGTVTEDTETEEERQQEIEMAKLVAQRRNQPSLASGVVGKKLI